GGARGRDTPGGHTRGPSWREPRLSCTNAPDYHRWPQQFPPLQRGILAGAAAAGAKLIVMENLYMYGPHGGAPMTEATPLRGHGSRSTTRRLLTEELFAAHRAGQVRAVSLRAFAELVGEETGIVPRMSHVPRAATRVLLPVIGLAVPPMRGLVENLYAFYEPYVVDHSAFAAAFGEDATPLREAIRQTV